MPKTYRKDVSGIEGVEEKLDVLIRLAALQLARNEETLRARAVLLDRAGLRPSEIARICNTSQNSVSVQLSAQRRRTNVRRRSS